MRVEVRHIESKGIGYNQGYTTLAGFFSHVCDNNWVPFLDLRGHIFDDGKFAANAGLGARYIASQIWGFNAYYDYRNTGRQHYNQVALGLECLGKIWDYRINGYVPVGDKRSPYYQSRFDYYKGNSVILSRKYQFAMTGANAEAGLHVNSIRNVPLYFALGPYYLTGAGATAWGGQLRASINFFHDHVELEGNTSYDHFFKWIGQGQISLNFPFGPRKPIKQNKPRSCASELALHNRAVQDVARFEIIPVGTGRKRSIGIDPATGQPYFVVFVNNTSHSSGTYESPYPTLALAEANSGPNNIIYVFPGDGTTAGMDAGITLNGGQKLWGSGTTQQLITTVGSISIPALTSTSPQMTNTAGDGVTLANNNEVSGLIITRAFNNGITGTAVDGIVIKNNIIFGSMASGINLTENGSSATITLDNLSVLNNVNGITLTAASNANVNISVTNSNISVNGDPSNLLSGNGLALFSQDTATIAATVINNTINNNQINGITLDSTSNASSPLVFNIAHNHFESNFATAVEGTFTGNVPVVANLANNIASGNVNTGNNNLGTFYLSFQGNTPSSVSLLSNNLSLNGYYGLQLQGGSSDLTVLLKNNTLSQNDYHGFYYTNLGPGTLNMDIIGNTFVGNCDPGIEIHTPGSGGTLNVNLANNIMTGNCGYAIAFTGPAAAINFVATDNTMLGNFQGILINAQGADITASISNNTINDNLSYGISIINTAIAGNNVFNVNISGNTIDSNEGYSFVSPPKGVGIGIEIAGSSTQTANISISSNQILYNQIDGIQITAPSGSLAINVDVDSNTVAYNHQNGLNIMVSGTPVLTSSITNNTANNNALSGINLTSQGTSTVYAADNFLSYNFPFQTPPANSGFQVSTSAGSMCLELTGNTSDTGYQLTNGGVTFNLAPLNVNAVNSGPITTTGVTPTTGCP
jgi:trimeric autotransporter adhesin